MGGIPNTSPPVPMSPGRWIGKIIVAVIVGEAIWGFLVSLTNGLIVPGLARVMGGDAQSPVYLGKGDFNLTGIFVSILELCLAGVVAILLNQWSSGPSRGRVKTIKVRTVKAAMPSIAPAGPAMPPASAPQITPAISELAPVAMAAAVAADPASLPVPSAPVAASPPAPKPAAPVAKPAAQVKPEKPKPHEVYYNIVGEPINPTEDDE
jgi:hypothetical protein